MASDAPVKCSVVVESDTSAFSGICRQILSILKQKNFSQDDVFAVHLAIEEAFTNAVKHGNKMDPDKKVQIEYSVARDKVEISIADQGSGFVPDDIPDPRFGKNLYRPQGRGLLLINSYMDEVEFSNNGKCLRMVRYRERPPIQEGRI
jgi:serine/threonine-protein kinase RsbW